MNVRSFLIFDEFFKSNWRRLKSLLYCICNSAKKGDLMKKTVEGIMQFIRENGIEMVDFKMVDINGQFRHVTIPAEDFNEEDDSFEILTDPDDFSDIRLALEEAGIPMVSAEVTMIPQTYVELTDEKDIKNIQKTLDLLDDDDDVQEVYHNWDE